MPVTLWLLLTAITLFALPMDAHCSGLMAGAYTPASVYDPGTNRHLIVYTELDEFHTTGIFGIFAGPDASPDGTPFRISDETSVIPPEARPAVSMDPESGLFLVLWSELHSGTSWIHAAVINSSGHTMSPALAISNPTNYAISPAVAFSPEAGTFIMAWQEYAADNYDILTRSATIINTNQEPWLSMGEIKQAYASPGDQNVPSIACHHDSTEDKPYCLLAFEDYTNSTATPAISGQIIDVLEDRSIMPLYNGLDISGPYGGYAPSVAATQRQDVPMLLAWSGPEGQIRARYMDTAGSLRPPLDQVFEPYGQTGPAEGIKSSFDTSTGRSALFWQDLYDGQRDIYASFLDPGETSGDIYHLTRITANHTTDEMNLTVSYNSLMPSFLVAYESSDNLSTFNIRLTTITDPDYPEISVTDTSYPYEDLIVQYPPLVYNSTVSHTLNIYNDSPLADLSITNITAHGPFDIAGQNCTFEPLAPLSDPCLVTVEFSPDMRGTATGILNITSSDPNEPLTSLLLSGTGIAPAIEVTDTSQPADDLRMDFGAVAVDSTSEGTITIRNTGDHLLSLGRIGGYPMHFSIATDNCSGRILMSSEHCTVVINASPTREGAHLESLWIASDDPSTPRLQFRLQAQGVLPHMDLTVPEGGLRFGSVMTGTIATSDIVLTNKGHSPLSIYTVSNEGEAFAVASENCSGKDIRPGGSCTLTVSFSPAETLNYRDHISIKSNDPEIYEATVSLSGSGALPIAAVHIHDQGGRTAEFGDMAIGMSTEQTLKITNIGLASLVLGDYTLNSMAFSVTSDQCSGATLPYAATCTVTIKFSPNMPGPHDSMLTMTTNESGQDGISVMLKGTGTTPVDNTPIQHF